MKELLFLDNQTSYLMLDGNFGNISIEGNNFFASFKNLFYLRFINKETLVIGNNSGIDIGRFYKKITTRSKQ